MADQVDDSPHVPVLIPTYGSSTVGGGADLIIPADPARLLIGFGSVQNTTTAQIFAGGRLVNTFGVLMTAGNVYEWYFARHGPICQESFTVHDPGPGGTIGWYTLKRG